MRKQQLYHEPQVGSELVYPVKDVPTYGGSGMAGQPPLRSPVPSIGSEQIHRDDSNMLYAVVVSEPPDPFAHGKGQGDDDEQ
ncbi:MAG: hypothetical protein WAV46_03370 [Candidatus Moraniibacteriota bacterium]